MAEAMMYRFKKEKKKHKKEKSKEINKEEVSNDISTSSIDIKKDLFSINKIDLNNVNVNEKILFPIQDSSPCLNDEADKINSLRSIDIDQCFRDDCGKETDGEKEPTTSNTLLVADTLSAVSAADISSNENVKDSLIEVSIKELCGEIHIFQPYSEAQKELNQLIKTQEIIIENHYDIPIPSAPMVMNKEHTLEQNCLPKEIEYPLSVRQRCSQSAHEEPSTKEDRKHKQLENLSIKPYTETQLMALYKNTQLDEIDNIVGTFLEHEKNVQQHKFHEIVLDYLRARTNLIGTEKEIRTRQEDIKKQKDKIWTFEERITSEEGTCEDDQLLTVNYKHEIACYQPNITKHITKQLKQLREIIYESYALHVYNAEISKLQVENYLQVVTSSCPAFTELAKNAPVQCYLFDHRKDLRDQIEHIKRCISILFSFCRRKVQDPKFVRDIKAWLSDLIAILLRVATLEDHLFILNHLIRCPAGVGDWGSHFLQIVPPRVLAGQETIESTLLDYLVTTLALLLQPAKGRDHFLQHYKISKVDSESEEITESLWVVVDSSGEDEEDVTEMWLYFKENDIIQFLDQIPFEYMFKHILLIESDGENINYDVSKATQHSIMKLFAFGTCLLNIFKDGLMTYSQARYKGVTKRISRLIRHTVHYITDHWQGFIEHYQNQSSSNSLQDFAMAKRLQVEYDEFFENATKTVFSSPRCGAWQFLAVIPFTSVSLSRLWKIAYKLHIGYEDESEILVVGDEDWPSVLTSKDTRGRFQDRAVKFGESESFYLLTSFANMAIVRKPHEKAFIEAIVSNIFDTAFVNEDTRTFLNRAGRDLFLTITSAHPFTISTLLRELQENLSSVGSLSLYLFRFLSLDEWHPMEEDLQCLSYWLIYTPVSSLESQLARIILAKMNWGFDQRRSALVLPKCIHERVALLVVEVALKISYKLRQGNFISEGVKQVTSAVYASSPEQVFLKWCWSMISQFHLHQLDQSDAEVQSVLTNPSLILKGVGDPTTSPPLQILKKGVDIKHPLALCTSLLVSSWGHSVPEICNHVPECLEIMVSGWNFEAALTVLSLVTPLFFMQYEELISDAKIINTLQAILAADQTYLNLAKSYITSDQMGTILPLFQSLILDQLDNFKRFNFDNASPIVNFWVHVLSLIPNWRYNLPVLKVLDVICQFSLFDPPSWQVLKNIFNEQRKVVFSEKTAKGGLGSLLTWVSGSSVPSSLLVRPSSTEVPWFALAVFICEAQEEISSGLWKGLLRALHNDPYIPLETAFKNVSFELALDTTYLNFLCLYRLGQQLIDLPCEHPAFPLTAQIFLTMHLSRTPPQPGQYDCTSMIYKFYEGYVNGNFLKKIKIKTLDVLNYWESELAKIKSLESENQSDDLKIEESYKKKMEFLSELTATLGGMSTWLEESRLYETGLYIPALPPRLLSKKLLLIFQENWEFWPELTDQEYLDTEKLKHLICWKKHRSSNSICSSSPLSSASSSPSHLSYFGSKDSNGQPLSPAASILKRLKEYDAPKAPPVLPAQDYNIPVYKEYSLNKDSLLYDIDRYTDLVINHAHSVLVRSKEMCELDCVYAELIPQLWTNPSTKTVLSAKCKPRRNSKIKECTGAASIVIEYCEKRLHEGINARIGQNRDQCQSLLNISTQTPPLQLCEAAVHLENLVNHIVHCHQRALQGGDNNQSMEIVNYGRKLFYQFVQLSSEDSNSYPPAKQLISSCTEVLGQEFLRGLSDCQEDLAVQVLNLSPQFGVLLSPHFTPMVTPTQMYITLYSSLSPSIASQPDLSFMLLSKFEMEAWLREKCVSCNERSQLINSVGTSLTSLLSLGNDSTVLCLELYRVHLRALLNFSFYDHFAQILSILLDLPVSPNKNCADVGINIWYDLLNTLSKGVAEFSPDSSFNDEMAAIRRYCQSQTIMAPQMIKDALRQLSSLFINFRLQFGLYGLYPKYKLYVKPIMTLLGMVSFSYIMTANQTSQQSCTDMLMQEIWVDLEGLWAAWISPLGGNARESCPQWIQELTRDKIVLLPWTPGDVTGPANAMRLYATVIGFFHETFIGSNALSMYLEYYHGTYASSAVKDHILCVVHSHMSALPWHHLLPSLKDVEILSKIMNEYLPECHSFIGGIFIQISWDKVVKNFVEKSLHANNMQEIPSFSDIPAAEVGDSKIPTSSSLVKLHILLLNILVRITMEPSVRQSGLLHPLLLSAESFHWQFMDAKNYESVINWLVMSCDPRIILNMHNRNPIDVALIRLLHVAAGYCRGFPISSHRSGPLKRRLLVRALCRLLATSATRHKALLSARRALFSETFSILMAHMEDTIVEGLPSEIQFSEGVSLSSEAVALIGGGSSPPHLQEICRDSLLDWLQGSHPSRGFLEPLAASISKGVLQLHHRSSLMEGSIQAIFDHAESCGEGSALCWSEVISIVSFPLSNPMSMLSYAAQENHLLVIFVHTKWRLHVKKASRGDQTFVLANLIELLACIHPDDNCEKWLPLIFGEAIDLIQLEVERGMDYECVWKQCKCLVDIFSVWGEDRASSGILAAIGLGQKSPLSVKMRLICKCLYAFLTAQLLSHGYFCSINEHSKSTAEINESSDVTCQESLKSLRHLMSLRTNSSYFEYKTVLDFAITFIQDCCHSILNTSVLLDGMVERIYTKDSCLVSLRKNVELLAGEGGSSYQNNRYNSTLWKAGKSFIAAAPKKKLLFLNDNKPDSFEEKDEDNTSSYYTSPITFKGVNQGPTAPPL